METTYKTFRTGDRVRDIYGRSWTVRAQRGCQVWVEGTGDWFHPSKLWRVAP